MLYILFSLLMNVYIFVLFQNIYLKVKFRRIKILIIKLEIFFVFVFSSDF